MNENINEQFILPRSLNIGEYIYVFKDTLKNDTFTYRCKHRTVCKVVIKINKDNLIKYKKNLLDEIVYSFSIKESEHKCKKTNEEITKDKIKNVATIKNYRELAKSLIVINLTKPLSFHIENLKKK